ncbi:MAG: response regulator [Chitinophagaceae bacterium]
MDKIFLVDDDALFLNSLRIDFVEHTKFSISTFITGELCIAELKQEPDLIILDYHLDGITPYAMNGLDTLDKIKAFRPFTPVVMLSSQDSIDVAVSCMHHGAYDYVVKSETAFFRLQKIIQFIVHNHKIEKELNWYMDRM